MILLDHVHDPVEYIGGAIALGFVSLVFWFIRRMITRITKNREDIIRIKTHLGIKEEKKE